MTSYKRVYAALILAVLLVSTAIVYHAYVVTRPRLIRCRLAMDGGSPRSMTAPGYRTRAVGTGEMDYVYAVCEVE